MSEQTPIVRWKDRYPGQTNEAREAAEQAVREAIRAQDTRSFAEEIELLWEAIHRLGALAGIDVAVIEEDLRP